MALSSGFKTYERGRRQAILDMDFSKGMYFSDGPLEDGYVKELVNFDIAVDKTSLITRPGLRTSELYYIPGYESYWPYSEDFANSTDLCIYDAKDCVEFDDRGHSYEYRQVILGSVNSDRLWVAGCVKNYSDQFVVRSVQDIDYSDNPLTPEDVNQLASDFFEDKDPGSEDYEAKDVFDDYSVVIRAINSAGPNGNIFNSSCVFDIVELEKIHDEYLYGGSVHSDIVGSFGFNNSYYFLNGSSSGNILSRTVYNKFHLKYQIDEVPVKELTPAEAVYSGYNMLDENPYVFQDRSGGSSVFQLQGILPYDNPQSNNAELMMTPKRNQDVWFRLYYDIPTGEAYKVVWDWKELTASSWTQLATQTVSSGSMQVLEIPFKVPCDNVLVRVHVYKANAGSGYSDVAENAITVGFDFSVDEHGTVNNMDQKNYDLSNAHGMFYWKNRLILYNVSDDPTIVFISDLNDPSYFPYPNNIVVFEEPVISVKELMDDLIVFTTDKLYQVKLAEDGNSWITTVLQSHLNIDKSDQHLILTVRNMLYFKSGDHYFMVVPKASSTTGELTLAPISNPMKEFFVSFSNNVGNIFSDVYNYDLSQYASTLNIRNLVDYYNFLDYDKVHNLYVYTATSGPASFYVNVDFIYDTVSRVWKIYVFQSPHKLSYFQYDAAHSGILAFVGRYYDNSLESYIRYIQLLQFDSKQSKDFWFDENDLEDIIYDSEDKLKELLVGDNDWIKFKNYQFLDTGYRNDRYQVNKRYRELQFQINNIDKQNLKFGLDFLIDGESRVTYSYYDVDQGISDSTDSYGWVFLDPVPIANIPVDRLNVIPDDIAYKTNNWVLNNSIFPDVNLWKIRVSVSGKGMAPRIKLLSYNESRYELLSVNWIYRMMYMR